MTADRWASDAHNLVAQGDFCASRQDWRGAYRSYGQAAEHLLKAIYLRNHQLSDMPPEMRTAASHDLQWLASRAGLSQDIAKLSRHQRVNWLVVRDWDQAKRYPNEPFPAKEGKDLKLALFNPKNGIWPWLLNLYQSN